jgi:hypothetical protein
MTPAERIQAEVEAIIYYPRRRRGELWLAEGDCCDMTGAITLFEQIDAEVRTIMTFSGNAGDTCYIKSPGDGSPCPIANEALEQ